MPIGVSCLWQTSMTASPLRRKFNEMGRGVISQDKLHQEGDADSDRPVASRPTTPELTDEEVSVLCDIERDGSTKSRKQPVVQSLN